MITTRSLQEKYDYNTIWRESSVLTPGEMVTALRLRGWIGWWWTQQAKELTRRFQLDQKLKRDFVIERI